MDMRRPIAFVTEGMLFCDVPHLRPKGRQGTTSEESAAESGHIDAREYGLGPVLYPMIRGQSMVRWPW